MKADPVDVAFLFDFYGDILTEKQKQYLEYYHHHDLSLSEIAENEGITRQGVRDVLVRAEAILRDMEDKLGLVARFGGAFSCAEQILQLTGRLITHCDARAVSPEIRDVAREIQTLARKIAPGESLENGYGI